MNIKKTVILILLFSLVYSYSMSLSEAFSEFDKGNFEISVPYLEKNIDMDNVDVLNRLARYNIEQKVFGGPDYYGIVKDYKIFADKAVKYLERAIILNSDEARVILADFIRHDNTDYYDLDRAFKLVDKAIENEFVHAEVLKAKMYMDWNERYDQKKGLEILKRLADTGNVEAIYLYTDYLVQPNISNYKEAFKYYNVAKDLGDDRADYKLYSIYSNSYAGELYNPKKAYEISENFLDSSYLNRAQKSGIVYFRSNCLFFGNGIVSDKKRAVQILEDYIKNNELNTMNLHVTLAKFYILNKEWDKVSKFFDNTIKSDDLKYKDLKFLKVYTKRLNVKTANEYYEAENMIKDMSEKTYLARLYYEMTSSNIEKSSDREKKTRYKLYKSIISWNDKPVFYDEVLNILGIMSLRGFGTPKDIEKAKEYYEMAYEAGNPSAINNLAFTYIDEKSNKKKDEKKYLELINKGISDGNPNSMLKMANYYSAKGDKDKELEFLLKAEKNGLLMAEHYLTVYYQKVNNKEKMVEYAIKGAEKGVYLCMNYLAYYTTDMNELVKKYDEILLNTDITYYKKEVANRLKHGYYPYSEKNVKKALNIYLDMAEKGDIDSIHNVIYDLYYKSDYLQKDEEKSLKLALIVERELLKKEPKGFINSKIKYSDLYAYIIGRAAFQDKLKNRDKSQALEYLLYSGKKNMNALNYLGVIYHDGINVEKDYEKAFDYYSKAAEMGQKHAMYNAANMYFDGEFVKKDYEKAYSLYKKSYENGNIKAAVYLGDMFADGIFVKKDINKAIFYYKEAAEKGDKNGLLDLSYIMLKDFDGVDHKSGFEAAKKLAEMDYNKGYYNLASYYYSGKYVKKDLKKYFENRLKAAEKGYVDANVSVAMCYYLGQGVKKNISLAKKYLLKYNNSADGLKVDGTVHKTAVNLSTKLNLY